MPENQTELFVRTTGGSIWMLGVDGSYHKPNCATIVNRDSDCVVAASNTVYDLVQVGDIIKIGDKFVSVEPKDIQVDNGHINSKILFDAVYTARKDTTSALPNNFELQAAKIAGRWFAMQLSMAESTFQQTMLDLGYVLEAQDGHKLTYRKERQFSILVLVINLEPESYTINPILVPKSVIMFAKDLDTMYKDFDDLRADANVLYEKSKGKLNILNQKGKQL